MFETDGSYLSKLLFGRDFKLNKSKWNRKSTIDFPNIDDCFSKTVNYRSDDGLVMYLLGRIEKLEKEVNELKNAKPKK